MEVSEGIPVAGEGREGGGDVDIGAQTVADSGGDGRLPVGAEAIRESGLSLVADEVEGTDGGVVELVMQQLAGAEVSSGGGDVADVGPGEFLGIGRRSGVRRQPG